jgi:hypothetical protein
MPNDEENPFLGFAVAIGLVLLCGYGVVRMARSMFGFRKGQKLSPSQVKDLERHLAREREIDHDLEIARAHLAKMVRLQEAQQDGEDVCWDCETINPVRCSNPDCGCCGNCHWLCFECHWCGDCCTRSGYYCVDHDYFEDNDTSDDDD